MRWTVCAATGAAVLMLAAGCGTAADTSGPTPGVPAAPQGGQPGGPNGASTPKNINVAAALAVSNKEFDLLKRGDWAAAWQLWTATAKKEVPKATFVSANTECPAALKRDYLLQDVQAISQQLVELTFRRGDLVHHGALRNDGKGWLFDPGTEILSEYASGAKSTVAKRKTLKQC